MKIRGISALLLCAAACAGQPATGEGVETAGRAPLAVLVASPKKLFENLEILLRKIRPDPEFEMRMSIVLARLGYPSFNGISEDKPAAFFEFDGEDGHGYAACVAAQPRSKLQLFARESKLPMQRFGEYLLILAPRGGNAEEWFGFAKSAISSARLKEGEFLRISASGRRLAEILEGLGVRREFAKFAGNFKNAKMSLSRRGESEEPELELEADAKDEGAARKAPDTTHRGNVEKGENAGLRFLNPEADITVFSGSGRGDTSIVRALNAFSSGAESLGKLSKECALPFAASFFNDGKIFTYVSVSGIRNGEPKGALDGFSYTEDASGGPNAPPLYTAESGGFFVKGNNLREFLSVLKKIGGYDGADGDFPLKKYADGESELTFILNNGAFLRSMGGKMEHPGIGVPPYTVLRVKLETDRAKVRAKARFDTAEYGADAPKGGKK